MGEPVAVAVASSRYVAEDALDAIAVRYEALQAVVRMPDARRDDVVLHEEQGTIWRRSTPSTSVISTRPGRLPTLAQPPLPCTGTGIHWKHVVWLPAIMPAVAN